MGNTLDAEIAGYTIPIRETTKVIKHVTIMKNIISING
jgi:hypothetical protein